MKTVAAVLQKNTAVSASEQAILLAHVLRKPREFLISNSDAPVSFAAQLKFLWLLKKRVSGFPIAHLTGHKAFFGLDFLVNKHTLVPRPETEVLVEATIDALQKYQDALLIDVGTGSGCIPIAIRTHASGKTIATDISPHALDVAIKNAKKHDVDIDFYQGDLLSPVIEKLKNEQAPIILTANLPYLTEKQFEEESSIQKEPKSALVAEDNGLALYKQLLDQTKHLPIKTMFFEIDPSQAESLVTYITDRFVHARVEIKKDLAGQDRIVKLSFPVSFDRELVS